jgi:hypothetical protein
MLSLECALASSVTEEKKAMQHKHATRLQALWSQLTKRRWSRWGISLIAVIAMLGALIIWGCSDSDNDIRIIVVNDTASTREDTPVTINVLANDIREDDDDDDDEDDFDDVTVTITTGPTNGTATVNEDNTITYTPNANFNGQDRFEYTVNNDEDDTNTGRVTVTVTSDAVEARGAALSNRAFVFADGSVFGVAPALGATTLTFGRFVGGTALFLLETENRMASGTATIASCDLQVTISTFGAAQGPQAGDLIALDPCLIDARDDGALTVTNADDVTATSGPARDSRRTILTVELDGAQEVPPVTTEATGTGILTVNEVPNTLTFALTYQGIASNVTVAHIHAGALGLSGSPIFFFCEDGSTRPGVDPCPEATEAPVTLSGTLTADDFQSTTNPTLPVATFAEAIEAILAGNTYFNVHSADSPTGEIRGQVENPE